MSLFTKLTSISNLKLDLFLIDFEKQNWASQLGFANYVINKTDSCFKDKTTFLYKLMAPKAMSVLAIKA